MTNSTGKLRRKVNVSLSTDLADFGSRPLICVGCVCVEGVPIQGVEESSQVFRAEQERQRKSCNILGSKWPIRLYDMGTLVDLGKGRSGIGFCPRYPNKVSVQCLGFLLLSSSLLYWYVCFDESEEKVKVG